MSYAFIPNIIVLIALVGIVVIIGRRIPQARELADADQNTLPGFAGPKVFGNSFLNKLYGRVVMFFRRVGRFLMEAKDIQMHGGMSASVKKIFVRSNQVGTSITPQKQEYVAPTLQPITAGAGTIEEKLVIAIKTNPKDFKSYARLGQIYLDNRNFDAAKKIYAYLVKHQPNNSTFFAKLGYSNLQLGQFSGAAVAYEQALGLDDAQPSRFYNLSLALMGLNKYREAQRSVQKALHLDPHNQKYQQALVQLVKLQTEPAKPAQAIKNVSTQHVPNHL